MTTVGAGVKEIRVRDEAGIFRMISRDAGRRGVCTALLPEKDAADEPFGFGIGEEATQGDCKVKL